MTTTTRTRLRQDLADLTDASTPEPSVLRELARATVAGLLPADDLFWCELDIGHGSAAIERAEGADAAMAARLRDVGHDHPAVAAYLRTGDRTPQRLSDVVAPEAWVRTATWRHLYAEHGGRFQLSVLVDLSPTVGLGWVVTRARSDFTLEELGIGRAVQPLLEAVWRMGAGSALHDEAPALTAREVDILRLLSTGATATAIGHQRGIAYGTVRKHIEHVYEKLGVHDRMLAVRRAAELGYLPRAR
jgi:DNA-binding CsgD family transcriptional regulator